jgi:hypothetical protein
VKNQVIKGLCSYQKVIYDADIVEETVVSVPHIKMNL